MIKMKHSMRRLATISFIVVLLASCEEKGNAVNFMTKMDGSPRTIKSDVIRWNFSCDFPEEFKEDARLGLDYWNSLAERELFVESDVCGVMEIYKRKVDVTLSFYKDDKEDDARSYAIAAQVLKDDEAVGGIVNFYKPWVDSTPETRHSVSRHELGHVLGFHHSDLRRCLMFSEMDRNLTDQKDVCKEEEKAFLQHYGKDVKNVDR